MVTESVDRGCTIDILYFKVDTVEDNKIIVNDYLEAFQNWSITNGIPKLVNYKLHSKIGQLQSAFQNWSITTGIPKLVNYNRHEI